MVAVDGDSVLLVLNYRAPVDQWVLEFPAGLLDANEDVAAAALRELAEETGAAGRVVDVSPPVLAE